MKSLHAKIWIVVFLIHFSSLLFFFSSPPKIKPPPRKLVVVTKTLIQKQEPPPPLIKTETKSFTQMSSIEKAKAKKPLPPKVKKAPPKTSKQILKKIEKRKAKTPLLSQKKVTPPTKVVEEQESSNYLETAFIIFRNTLVLPEKGPVKLTLTINPHGKIEKIVKESSDSQKNLDYLLELLPHLTLPPLEKNQETTFTVLFTNE